jgi:hypothetical protein
MRTTATSTIEEATSLVKDFQEESAGFMGTVNDSTSQYKAYRNSIENVGKNNLKIPESFAESLFDTAENSKNLQTERLPQFGNSDSAGIHRASIEINQELLREQIASLYALAFVTHVNLLVEQATEESEQANNRDFQQATYEKILQTASRLNRILLLETEMASYEITLRVLSLKQFNREDDDASTEETNNELVI